MIFKRTIQSFLVLSSILLANPQGTCWVIDDQTKTLYTFNMQTLDAPIETPIDQVNEGEGLAYRPSTHELYMWNHTQTIVRNADTGVIMRQYNTSYANEIEGASFYTDPISKEEELWVIVEENATNFLLNNERYIQRVDIDTGAVLLDTRKKLYSGFMDNFIDYGNDIGSLAIDPNSKTFWITKDSSNRKIATVNPSSGEITNVKILTPEDMVDAEVLAFDINGVMYTESDRGDTDNDPRYLWKINLDNASMSKATPQFGTGFDGDLEGMACNSSANKEQSNPFVCTNEGHIFNSNTNDLFTNGVTIDLENGTLGNSTQFATRHINAAGYNVNDNFIYGMGFQNSDHNLTELVQVDKDYKVTTFSIPGLPQTYDYAYGDVSFDDKYYFSEHGELNQLRVIDLKTKTMLPSVSLVYPDKNSIKIYSADYAFNPIDKMLYVVNSTNHKLTKINPETGVVTEVGNVGLKNENIYSVISFFDLKGNYYFNNNDANKMFKIDITNPDNVNAIATPYLDGFQLSTSGDGAKCAYSYLPNISKGVPGSFNVERVGSDNLPINSDERNAWYTQIVGKDFDYHVVFYDENMTKEVNLTNVPIKVELIDQDKNMSIAAPHYDYFSELSTHKSRVVVTRPIYDKDLKNTFASKNARFRVQYPTYSDGSIKPYICNAEVSAEECYNQALASTTAGATIPKYSYARDNFAIRPDIIYVNIADHNESRLNSKKDSSISLAAGYKYNLTVTATQYLEETPAKGYTKEANSSMKLDTTNLTSCNDTSAISEDINFTNGLFQDSTFSHHNVGKYLLKIEDDKSWTEVDQNSSIKGCIEGSGDRITNAEGKVGCDIIMSINNPIELNFQPDHFAVNLNMLNLPSSGHPDFIYMMELNVNNDNVAIAFNGTITAQSENNTTTSNFTAGCVATNLLLDLNATTVSDEGPNHDIHTADNMTLVNFSRVIRFNGETNPANFDVNNTLRRINTILPISSNRFLNDRNGSMSLDMRYNLNKTLQQPINPVEVRFHSIDVNSSDANSSAHQIDNHVPSGTKAFLNNVRNFYFARVVSDLNNYPRVNMHVSPMVRTPLNVDIYCATTAIANYCRDRNVLNHTSLSGTVREQNGWYLSTDHNGSVDGNVTALTPDSINITLIPNPTPTKVDSDDITLNGGHTGLPNGTFKNCTNPTITVTISTDPALDYIPSNYKLNCTNTDPSQWTGIGKNGNILKITPKVNKSGKMDW